MGFKLQGFSGVQQEVEANTRAGRITAWPKDVGSLGSYSIEVTSGTIAAGMSAAATVWGFRWTSSNAAIIQRITMLAHSLGTGFTAGTALFELLFARSWTVADTSGATATITTNNGKLRTSFGTTLVQEIRYANTGALTAGTRTLDAQALASTVVTVTAATNTVFVPSTNLWTPDVADGSWPIILAANEGAIIRGTVPATGTWTLRVGVQWAEVAAF